MDDLGVPLFSETSTYYLNKPPRFLMIFHHVILSRLNHPTILKGGIFFITRRKDCRKSPIISPSPGPSFTSEGQEVKVTGHFLHGRVTRWLVEGCVTSDIAKKLPLGDVVRNMMAVLAIDFFVDFLATQETYCFSRCCHMFCVEASRRSYFSALEVNIWFLFSSLSMLIIFGPQAKVILICKCTPSVFKTTHWNHLHVWRPHCRRTGLEG